MKAVSLRQPWASLIAHGHKHIETRSWKPAHTGALAIHASLWKPGPRQIEDPESEASAALDEELLWPLFPAEPVARLTLSQRRELFLTLPFGAVVATARLVDVLQIACPDPALPPILLDARGRVVREVNERERPYGCYATGRHAWVLANVVPLDPPVPVRGALDLWVWNEGPSPVVQRPRPREVCGR